MRIRIGTTSSEKNAINKNFNILYNLTGTLRGESSVTSPSILIEADNLSSCNYMRIDEFGRYYYITDIISVRNGLWRIEAKSDPLMSFKSEILGNNAIIKYNENIENLYIPDSRFVEKAPRIIRYKKITPAGGVGIPGNSIYITVANGNTSDPTPSEAHNGDF